MLHPCRGNASLIQQRLLMEQEQYTETSLGQHQLCPCMRQEGREQACMHKDRFNFLKTQPLQRITEEILPCYAWIMHEGQKYVTHLRESTSWGSLNQHPWQQTALLMTSTIHDNTHGMSIQTAFTSVKSTLGTGNRLTTPWIQDSFKALAI